MPVERPGRRDGDLAGDHGLHQPTGPHGVTRRRDRGEVRVDGRDRLDRVAVGGRGRPAGRRQRLVGGVDRRHPRRTVRRLHEDHRRDDHLSLGDGSERHPSDRPGTGTSGALHVLDAGRVEAGVVVVVDRRQCRHRVVDGHPGRHAAPGEPDAVAHEQEAVAPGDVVEVEAAGRLVGELADGPHQSRVPVSSWVMPNENCRCRASPNPAATNAATIWGGAGR